MSYNLHYWLVPLIDVKFSARIVIIHLTALLEYLRGYCIRVFNLGNPPTYNNHRAEKITLEQSLQHRLSFLAYTEFNKDRFY